MPRKKRERIEKHKQSLGDVLEDPETYGVRVSHIAIAKLYLENIDICHVQFAVNV